MSRWSERRSRREGSPFALGRGAHAALALAVIVLAVVLRAWGIGKESLWLDEAVSLKIADQSIGHVLNASARDSTPALYFVGLYFWRSLAPDTDAAVRMYSTLWSLAGLLAMYALARAVAERWSALAAMSLLAIHPLDIYFAQEARMYCATAALLTASLALLWVWLRDERPRRFVLLAAYSVAAALALLCHYVAIAVLLAQGTFVLFCLLKRRRCALAGEYLLAALVTAALFLCWYAYMYRVNGGFNRANFSWMKLPGLWDYVIYVWCEFFWGRDYWSYLCGLLLTVPLTLLVLWNNVGLIRRHAAASQQPRSSIAPGVCLLWMVVGPALFAGLLSHLYQPIYLRYNFALFLLPPFVLLCVLSVGCIGRRRTRVVLFAAFAGVFLLGCAGQYRRVHKTNWRLFAQVYNRSASTPSGRSASTPSGQSGAPDAVVFFPSFQVIPANRYLGETVVSAPRDGLASRSDLAGKTIWLCHLRGHKLQSGAGEEAYYQWLMSLGPQQCIPLATDLDVTAIHVKEDRSASTPSSGQPRLEERAPPVERRFRAPGMGNRVLLRFVSAGCGWQP
ncbi:MAG: glycosyltransferase family 39 protein [bacterium]